jgi:hypothetical protein
MARWSVALLAVGLVMAAAILRLVPRYEIRTSGPSNLVIMRIDRWSGVVEIAGPKRLITAVAPASWLTPISDDAFLRALEQVRGEGEPAPPR